MQEKSKRILTIILFFGSVAIMGIAMYLVFFAGLSKDIVPSEEQATEELSGTFPSSEDGVPQTEDEFVTPTEGDGALPQAESSPIADGGTTQTIALTTGPVENTTLASDGKSMNFYNNEDGKFYAIDKNGNVNSLSNQVFPDVKSVAWNKESEKAVVVFPDESKIIYDFANEKQFTLPRHWDDVAFSPSSNEVIAKSLALDPDNRWLVISKDDGSNTIPIQALGTNEAKVQIAWSPNDQVVAFADTAFENGASLPSGFGRNIIYPVGKNKENFKGLLVEGFGFKPSWSPSGKTILYSVYGDYSQGKPLLWLVDGTSSSMGENRHSIGLNTWVDKCVWSNDTTIYCAVPQNLPNNAGLQPTLYENLPDALYKVDVANNKTALIAIPDVQTVMKNLSVSSDESSLFYTDVNTGQLKLIKLK